jgi:alpha-glucosidase (family GH31 glycosyl hydrolase)
LRFNIPMGLGECTSRLMVCTTHPTFKGASLSGFANTGHDVCGFAGDAPEPELFLRWIQNGSFHPRFCIHSWRTDDGENSPWLYVVFGGGEPYYL